MRVDVTVQEFTEGELSPSALGQTGKAQYHKALEKAKNVFVDFQGGFSSRPGTHFNDFVQHDDKEIKFAKFDFSPDIASTYLLVFGDYYLRFLQDGVYVTESTITISSISQTNPAVVTTASPHGFSNGDWIIFGTLAGMTELSGVRGQVSNVTASTFELQDVFGVNVDATGFGGFTSGVLARIYTVTTPYPAADLPKLKVRQKRNLLSLVHKDHAPMDLVRLGHANWTLTASVFGATLPAPTGLTTTASAVGTSGTAFVVTSVAKDGSESLASEYAIERLATQYDTIPADSVKLSWTAVAGAEYYNIYRSLILNNGAEITRGMDVGFIGRSYGTTFVDNSLTPDFLRTPPLYKNPFRGGEIDGLSITAGGSGHDDTTTVSVSGGGGTGFVGYPIIAGGVVTGIRVINPGYGYVSPTVSFGGAGTGATAIATASSTSGRNPQAVTVHQQRRVFAATEQEPLTIWGSRPAAQNNFDYSLGLADDDSWEHELDSDRVAPIRHLLSTRSGLLAFTQEEIVQLAGGAKGITPTFALAEPESYTGSAEVAPMRIDTDILYLEGKGTTVRLLTYNDYTKVFAGDDVSAASGHFFPADKEITDWCWAQDPHKLVMARRNDGHMLVMTFIKEKEIRAWAEWTTAGLFEDVISLREGKRDQVYVLVKRFINGRWTKFIERFDSREFSQVEDAWCVDCGLSLQQTYPAADLTLDALSGTGVTITASASVFGAASVGDILRAAGGKAKVSGLISGTQLTIDWITAGTDFVPETNSLPRIQSSGSWTLDTPTTSVSGLGHLEGEVVSVLADGNYVKNLTVTNGALTLPAAATKVIVGLGFTYKAKTLPPTSLQYFIDQKIKKAVEMSIRVRNTRGVSYGNTETNLYELKERTDEPYNEPTKLQTGVHNFVLSGFYSREGGVWLVGSAPLPFTLLSYTMSVEVEDVHR